MSVGLLVALSGCLEKPDPLPDAGELPFYVEGESPLTVHGYVWDPEAYIWSLFTCVENCDEAGPIGILQSKHLTRALIGGATVSVVEPGSTTGIAASGPTDGEGSFTVAPVPTRQNQPYYLTVDATAGALVDVVPLPPEDAGTLEDGGVPQFDFPVASSTYVPTYNLRPVEAMWSYCYVPFTTALSKDGILDAVARFLTFTGTPTTVDDLSDPARFGGVAVWRINVPYHSGFYWAIRFPSDAIEVKASVGQLLAVDWAPPGVLPPPFDALQSARGFLVSDQPTSSTGIVVVLLPAATTPTTVSLTFKDTKTGLDDITQLMRPWTFNPVERSVPPGIVSYGEVQGVTPAGYPAPLDNWLCVPPTNGSL